MRALPLLAVLVLAASGCCSPSECRPAREGRAHLQPVAEALAAYRAAHGAYPDSAEVLVPAYLPALPARPEGWGYGRDSVGYSLEFSYTGPGMNRCAYRPDDGWACQGYY